MFRFFCLLVISLLNFTAVHAFTCLPANSPGTQTITAIKINDKASREIDGLKVIPPKDDNSQSVTVPVGCAFAIGTVIQLPTNATIELTSSNENRITLFPGSRLRIHNVSSSGETYSIETGRGLFNVKKALDFFNVSYQSFMAAVRGTIFTVEVKPESEITFAVEEGKLLTEREVKVKIEEGDKVASIKVIETLQPGKKQTATYRLDVDEYLKTFKTYQGAEEYFRKQLEEDRKNGDQDRLLDGLNNMGLILSILDKPNEAISYFDKGLKISQESKKNYWRRVFLNNLGTSYTDLKESKGIVKTKTDKTLYDALDYLEEASRLEINQNPQSTSLITIYNNIGTLYAKIYAYKKAIKYYEMALEIAAYNGSFESESFLIAFSNLGKEYALIDKEKAIKYLEKAMRLSKNKRVPLVEASIYNAIGYIYLITSNEKSDIKLSIDYFIKSLDIYNKLFPSMNNKHKYILYNNLCNAYDKIGDNFYSMKYEYCRQK